MDFLFVVRGVKKDPLGVITTPLRQQPDITFLHYKHIHSNKCRIFNITYFSNVINCPFNTSVDPELHLVSYHVIIVLIGAACPHLIKW